MARSAALRHAGSSERRLDPLTDRGRPRRRRQNPHSQEPCSSPDRLVTQTVHSQSERLFPELLCRLPSPSARPARAPMPLYHPPGTLPRAAINQLRRSGGVPTQEPVPRRHHPHTFKSSRLYRPPCRPRTAPTHQPHGDAQSRYHGVFDIDITRCPLCGGQPRVIADITDPDLIRKILDHVQKRALPRLPPRPNRLG